MGATVSAIGGLAKSVIDQNELRDKENAQEEMNEKLDLIANSVHLKIDKFYNELLLEGQSPPKNSTVPICNVVDKVQSLFVHDSEDTKNVISCTINKVVRELCESKWSDAITDGIAGSLEAFLGPEEIASSGTMSEKKSYHVAWSNNAMVRLDVFATKCVLSHMAGLSKSSQIFGGYIMVASVVDMQEINFQVFLWEFSKFVGHAKKIDPNAFSAILCEIREVGKLVKETGLLFNKVSDMMPKIGTSEIDGEDSLDSGKVSSDQNV
ncbi:hypothetical protein BSL78_16341 [Apostichopus japonicus]|uniref:Uncharacterized protein n=1 Tax=Stichopus japonicus TaxID=307972 RepID=A0A2G8KFN8_STIJA|nr:hypothetical protein BSL78_16341 [Apostichopus japonicus]